MPAGIFEFGLTAPDLIRLRRFFVRSPKYFARAARNVVNLMALDTRTEGLNIIDRSMTIRNRRFVKGSIWADLQRGSPPLRDVAAAAGSLRRRRFTGWEEQELGKPSRRKRQATLESRRGQEGKQMFAGARMKPGRQIPSPNQRTRSNWNFADTPQFSRAQVMIMALSRQGYRGPFIIEGHPKFPRGMYRFKGRKKGRRGIRLLQLFTVRKPRPKRVRWLSRGAAKAVRGAKGRDLWGRAVNQSLPKRLR